MKEGVKVALTTVGISLIIAVVVHVVYYVITDWQIDRALVNRHEIRLRPQRGNILDASGAVIANTDSCFDVFVDTAILDSLEWVSYTSESVQGLTRLFPQRGSSAWLEYLDDGRSKGNRYLPIARNLTKEEADAVKELPLFILHPYKGGGIIELHHVRRYPFDTLARSTIGTANEETKVGLELSFDYILYGMDGKKVFRTGRFEGQDVQRIDWMLSPRDGGNVHTTLDMRAQSVADSVLRASIEDKKNIESACVIMMDTDGAVRVMANLGRSEKGGVSEIRNEAVMHTFEPAGLAESMSYAALLSDTDIRIDMSSSMTAEKNLSNQVLRYFSDNPQAFVNHLLAYCPAFDFDLDMKNPRIPSPHNRDWNENTLSQLSVGKGFQMSPLSVLAFYNALANHGQMVTPFLVEMIGNRPMKHGAPAIVQIMPEAIADSLFCKLISDKPGRGKAAGETPEIANATGICRDASTFVGWFPAQEPKYSVICTIFGTGIDQQPLCKTLPERVVKSYMAIIDRDNNDC